LPIHQRFKIFKDVFEPEDFDEAIDRGFIRSKVWERVFSKWSKAPTS
jgi:hypothetical protein